MVGRIELFQIMINIIGYYMDQRDVPKYDTPEGQIGASHLVFSNEVFPIVVF